MSGDQERRIGLSIAVSVVIGVFVAGIIIAQTRSAAAVIITLVITTVLIVAFSVGLVMRSKQRRESQSSVVVVRDDVAELLPVEGEEKAIRKRYSHLSEIPTGTQISNVRRGEVDGRIVTVFQSLFMIATPQATIPITHSIYATDAPGWPVVRVTKRNFFHILLFRLGRRPGLMLDLPEFNRTFIVTTTDDDFALLLLSPEMQEFMLGKPEVRWRIGYDAMCMVYKGALKTDRMASSLDRFRRFWSLVPPELAHWPPEDESAAT